MIQYSCLTNIDLLIHLNVNCLITRLKFESMICSFRCYYKVKYDIIVVIASLALTTTNSPLKFLPLLSVHPALLAVSLIHTRSPSVFT